MNNYPNKLRNKLLSLIDEVVENKVLYAKDPTRDFTRNRKLDLKTMLKILLSMGGNSLNKELLDYFQYDTDTATASAFIQSRDKILPCALEFIFQEMIKKLSEPKLFKGYRLFAVDGTKLSIAYNPNDADTFFKGTPNKKGFNQLHLNAIYDLCNNIYIDSHIQLGKKTNERVALVDMVKHSTYGKNTIIVADRGYESYNVFAHLHEKGLKYLIRVKDNAKRCIIATLGLPHEDEFDTDVDLIITRKMKYYGDTMYKYLPSNCNFDFADLHNNEFYNMSFRVVRFKIPNNSFETIITNLDSSEFTPSDINTIYNMRWGIETSFRALKYSVGLSNFHSKKVEHITQEIFARLIMYNFCEMITLHVIVSKNSTKHIYKANFTLAIIICKHFIRLLSNHHPPDIEALINKYILPIRDGRTFVRKIKTKSSVSFLYRIA